MFDNPEVVFFKEMFGKIRFLGKKLYHLHDKKAFKNSKLA